MPTPAALSLAVKTGRACIRWSDRTDGDFNADTVPPGDLAGRWRVLAGVPVTWLDEVHGVDVVTVGEPGQHVGVIGDALVTDRPGAGLGIWVGDCAPVALVAAEGVVAAAHVGWRGLEAGVLEAVVAAMHAKGAEALSAFVGPCVHHECYEFGAADLDRLATRFGDGCRATTSWGSAALDVPAAITSVLHALGVGEVVTHPSCTACDAASFWSHRARGERGRQAMAVWLEAAGNRLGARA